MPELVLTPRFERAFRRLIAKNPAMQTAIEVALLRMAEDLRGYGLELIPRPPAKAPPVAAGFRAHRA